VFKKDLLKSDILLVTPPFTQLNTPYPATVYLKGFLNTKGISSTQVDLGMDVISVLFSQQGLKDLFNQVQVKTLSGNAKRIYHLQDIYIQTIDSVMQFLRGQNSTLAHAICSEQFLPEASRFNQINDLEWAFGNMGLNDKAKHLATLYLEDISDFIIETTDPHFGFSRYAERISSSAHNFDELYETIAAKNSYITDIMLPTLEKYIIQNSPKIVCFSIPFPGNLLSAFKCGQFIKQHYPNIKVAFGGGFPNTELRSVKDPRVFEFIDFICLDDGEAPIEQLYKFIIEKTKPTTLKRTFYLEGNKIKYANNPVIKDYPQKDIGTPDYSDLKLDQYISVIEVTNPMHSLWSDGRWNKLTLAHGCYWGKCTFCDVSLDYIQNYDPVKAEQICDRIETIIEATGETGFHFVDEAAPPALMRDLAITLLRRNITITWWTNIRFEKNFSADLCQLLKTSGCIAVSGGIEVASDRLLKLIDKGIDLQQLTHVTSNFTEAGIMVHAYLMYGFPSQSDLETINSLEVVRQLFEHGLIQSGFWHQFAMTAHSPVGLSPQQFKVENLLIEEGDFANNDLPHYDKTGIDHTKYSHGLKTAIYNYMHGAGFELELNEWFDFKIKSTTISPNFIESILEGMASSVLKPSTKVIWTGKLPQKTYYEVKKKGKTRSMARLEGFSRNDQYIIKDRVDTIECLYDLLKLCHIQQRKLMSFKSVDDFYKSKTTKNIEILVNSATFDTLRNNGLLLI